MYIYMYIYIQLGWIHTYPTTMVDDILQSYYHIVLANHIVIIHDSEITWEEWAHRHSHLDFSGATFRNGEITAAMFQDHCC